MPASSRGLRHVADHGHRPARAAAHQQPPGHRRQLLRLVDDHVAEDPGAVGGGALGGGPACRSPRAARRTRSRRPRRSRRGLSSSSSSKSSDREPSTISSTPSAYSIASRRSRAAARALQRVVHAEQLGQLVEQRHVGRGPAGARGRAAAAPARRRSAPAAADASRSASLSRSRSTWRGVSTGHSSNSACCTSTSSRSSRRVSARSASSSRLSPPSGSAPIRSAICSDSAWIDLGDEDRPGQVVRAAGAAGRGPGVLADGPLDAQRVAVVVDLDVVVRHGLPVGDRVRRARRASPSRPLSAAAAGGSAARARDAREHVAEGGQQHAGLGERRQHLGDVAQEGRVGPEDQHALLGELGAVGVEQVGRAVQRHRGLAGARAALHDEHAGQPGADHLVLLGLDGLDDVAHPAGAVGGQRGQQRGLAGHVLAAARRRRPRGRAPRRRCRSARGPGCAGAGGGSRPPATPRWPGRTAGRPGRASRSAADRGRGPRRRARAGRCSADCPAAKSSRPKHRPFSTAFIWASCSA